MGSSAAELRDLLSMLGLDRGQGMIEGMADAEAPKELAVQAAHASTAAIVQLRMRSSIARLEAAVRAGTFTEAEVGELARVEPPPSIHHALQRGTSDSRNQQRTCATKCSDAPQTDHLRTKLRVD